MNKINDLKKRVKKEANVIALICLLVCVAGYIVQNLGLIGFGLGGGIAAIQIRLLVL